MLNSAVEKRKIELKVRTEIEPLAAKKKLVIDRGLCTVVPRGVFAQEIDNGICRARRIVSPTLPVVLHLLSAKTMDDERSSRIRAAVWGAVKAIGQIVLKEAH